MWARFPQMSKKTGNKFGLIFASSFDRRKVNPLVYVKQACLPSLLFGAEVWTLTPTFLLKLERCQYWFLKHIFYVPEFAPGPLLLKLSGLNSIESEVATKKLLYLLNQMILPFHFSSTMAVRESFKFSITAVSLSYDVCSAFQN